MNLDIIGYCAEECERQASGELSVYDMCNAWNYAQEYFENQPVRNHYQDFNGPNEIFKPRLDLDFIEQLGKLVEPKENKNGFRKIPIGVSDRFNWIEKAPWERVSGLLAALIEAYYSG